MIKRLFNKKKSEVFITVSAAEKKWMAEQEKSFKNLQSELVIKGYKKGTVPLELAKKQISESEVRTKALNNILGSLTEEAAKELKEDELILGSPTYDIDSISEKELTLTFRYPVCPNIKLPNYKKTGINFKGSKPTAKVINSEVERILKSRASKEDKKGPVDKGDYIKFDYEGRINGELFPGSKAKGLELEIGTKQFVPGFDEKVIGMTVGEEKNVEINFPKDYYLIEIRGKKAIFNVKLLEAKTFNVPKLDDEFIKSLGLEGMDNVAKLKEHVKKVYSTRENQQLKIKFQRQIFDKMKKEVEINFPEPFILMEMETLAKQFRQNVESQGTTVEQYMKMTGDTTVSLEAKFNAQATDGLKDALLFSEISKAENIELTDKDYDAQYKNLALAYGKPEDELRKMIAKEQLKISMINERVVDLLIKYNS